MKEAISEQSSDNKLETKVLEDKLEKLEASIKPMKKMKKQCKVQGAIQARKWVNGFAAIILGQFAFSQYGTYVIYSWDIIEPITCAFSMSDVFLGFTFWMVTKQPWTIYGLNSYFSSKIFMK